MIIRLSRMGACRLAFAVLLLVFVKPALAEDFDFGRYQPSNLRSLQEEGQQHRLQIDPEVAKGKVVFQHHPELPPYRLRLSWTGGSRGLSDHHRECMQASAHVSGPTEHLFQRELEMVDADGRRIWMPIQEALYPPFRAEFRPAALVELYATLLAFIDGQPVLTINEFNAVAADARG